MTIHAFVSGSDAAVPGDNLDVILNNGVTSLCDSTVASGCEYWSEMSVHSVTIEAPESPVQPSVSLSVPQVTTICNQIVPLDITGTSAAVLADRAGM